jgi:DNA polymerase elongation subunit (family B)
MSDGNYIAAWVDYRADRIVVLERSDDGVCRKLYKPPYYFYLPDESGEYESIFGDRLIRAEFDSREEYEEAKRRFKVKFESDIAPLKRVLMDYYYDRPAPKVHYAFIDIEVDYASKIGYAGPTNPYAPINAITIYQSWTKKYLIYVVPPKGWNNNTDSIYKKINELISEKKLRDKIIPEITICADELELLVHMVSALGDADIISGWNSEFFDIPYICERLRAAGGDHMLLKLEHVGAPPPKMEMMNHYGTDEPIWKFSGKSHLDYMKLFQKFTFEGRVSYSLGNILEEEVDVGKLEYDGTLEELYHNDFETFVAYNFRDVDGIVQLDEKFKFIALTNQMAHENTVHFDAVLGTVAYVETAITNHAHYKLKKIVHDKIISEHEKVEGAIVLTPKIGLHEWIGSADIASEYPNTIRSLNISPEMMIGQFSAKEEAWREIRKSTATRLTLIFNDGTQEIATAAEWKQVLQLSRWAITGYGTVFDQSRGRGVVPDIVGFWYTERKRLQAEMKKWVKKVHSLEVDTPEYLHAKKQEEYYDLLQLTKKISMNSLYGALLNVAFRFGREELGASVTATGRQITTFMIETIDELISGTRHALVKTTSVDKNGKIVHEYSSPSPVIIYSDTDSVYFKTLAQNKEEAIKIADSATASVNEAFPAFMREAFNCQDGFDSFISAGREIVGVRGLFQAKKKYIVKIVDKEGYPPKPGKDLKTQGSEIKKSDTPKVIQDFLKSTLDMILDGKEYLEVAEFINVQRKELLKKKVNLFLVGIAKQVNNLDKYAAAHAAPGSILTEAGRKLVVPWNAKGALNYNSLVGKFEPGAKLIKSGDKVVLFYLKPNEYDFNIIAFPAELTKFPKWFNQFFKVDTKLTENKMIDSKLKGVFAALGKDVPSPQSMFVNSLLEF